MIDDFEQVKKQLVELAPVINAFKSEAVQLRVVELLFSRPAPDGSAASAQASGRARSGRKRKGKRGGPAKAGGRHEAEAREGKAPRKSRVVGPATILTQLLGEGFFQTKRIIGDIIQHCKLHKARTLKSNVLSTPLARFVRDGRLKREKNKDGQFQYYKG